MPLYQYECENCGARFEALRSIADRDNQAKCPECGHESTNRICAVPIAPFGFGLMGPNGGPA